MSRTGIRERRISHVGLEELAYVAAARALACAGLAGSDVELIVFGTGSHDDQVPNMASGIQRRLGAQPAAAYDINTACTSFLYGLSAATALIRTGVVRNALVIGAELISPFMDWSDRDVAVFRIAAVSVISTIKVERPRARLSDAPMRVKMRSIRPSRAERAGTNDPICASNTIRAACRR